MEAEKKYFSTSEWLECEAEDVGMDSHILAEADKEIRNRYKRINSMLVIKNGLIVFEKYYNGFSMHDLHETMSVTKSFISTLIGIAIDKKYIESTKQRVIDFFPEYASADIDYFYEELTIEHLLTMTSGIYWQDGTKSSEQMCDRMNRSNDWIKFILSLPIQPEMIGEFRYSSANSHLLSAIITKATKINAKSFAKLHLFDEIGIKEYKWREDPQGNSEGSSWLALKPRDQARFGCLFLNNGCFNNKSVISEQWVSAATSTKNDGNEFGQYGYQWWIKSVNDYKVYFAAGFGGQYILIVPKLEIVVVIASNIGNIQSRSKDPVYILDKYIIPSVK